MPEESPSNHKGIQRECQEEPKFHYVILEAIAAGSPPKVL